MNRAGTGQRNAVIDGGDPVRLGLRPAELLRVTEWLTTRPDPEALRLEALSSPEHQRLFLEVAIAVADVDKVRYPAERRALSWLTGQLAEIARQEFKNREEVHMHARGPG